MLDCMQSDWAKNHGEDDSHSDLMLPQHNCHRASLRSSSTTDDCDGYSLPWGMRRLVPSLSIPFFSYLLL